jgi:hypothetical protein
LAFCWQLSLAFSCPQMLFGPSSLVSAQITLFFYRKMKFAFFPKFQLLAFCP